jgi:tetratricopeptide (TPR) repeat protein
VLGDLYQLTGESKLAEQQYATVRAIARLAAINKQVYNRQLVLFDANHGVNLAEALDLAEQELAVRKDTYGYDAYAWALLANGRAAEADEAMAHALSLGTRDAQLLYHAGMIAQALGDQARARTLLSDALALNPGFDPLQAVRARAALEELR